MPLRVAEVMQFHGQNPPYISMCFRSFLLLQSRTKLALFLALSFTSHKRNIFSFFLCFSHLSHTPHELLKKKKNYLVPKSTTSVALVVHLRPRDL